MNDQHTEASMPQAVAFKAQDGYWYLEFALSPSDAYENWAAYGWLESLDEAKRELALLSNEFALTVDESGKRQGLECAPNGFGLLLPADQALKMKKPKFDRYFDGLWRYHPSSGVGLRFVGKPTDPDAFIELLQGESCNPIATRRILDSLMKDGERSTTVMAHLHFNYIGDELAKLGVTMHIVDPRAHNQGITPALRGDIDHKALSLFHGDKVVMDKMNNLIKAHIKREKAFITKQVHEANATTSFGPYSRNRQESAASISKRNKKAFSHQAY